MAHHSVVLAKQVPDTANLSGKVMKDDGTVNRAALAAIFNPDDLCALEMALDVKDRTGGTVTVITMGPPSAAEVLRESLYRGADRVVLLTDRKAAGSDTLATSYLLARAVAHVGDYDLVFCGRQAIDGDTAQVGPQVAEKLGLPQVTYAEAIEEIDGGDIVVRRALPLGTERVRCPLPCLLTVVGGERAPRPPSARRMVRYKMAASPFEYAALAKRWPELGDEAAVAEYVERHSLAIPVWTAADVGADLGRLGLEGSPTKVAHIEFVVLESHGSEELSPTREGVQELVRKLVDEYIV